tara:strand:- start:8008 stop:8760 length:753 start_codon:yes stop_codon:yes gene_type:complete
MLVDDLKIFYVHIPRCGGTSINRWFHENRFIDREKLAANGLDLGVMYGKLQLDGVTIELDTMTQDHFRFLCSEYVQSEYRKIAVVRDPFERAISVYKRMRERGDRRILPAHALFSFRHWVDEVAKVFETGVMKRPLDVRQFPHARVSHLIPQSHFITDPDENLTIDHALMLKDLSAGWIPLMRKLNVNLSRVDTDLSASAHSSDPETSLFEDGQDADDLSYERQKIYELYECDYALLSNVALTNRMITGA